MRALAILLFVAALSACGNSAGNQSASWDSADPCWRDDVMNGGNGSLCKQ
jgi:hypothetical protein